MILIKENDFIASIADALQYISCFHPPDFIQALHQAYLKEESSAAKNAIAQILINSRLAALGHRPLCQDTGIVSVFLKVGMNVQWESQSSLSAMVDEGVRRAYLDQNNPLRASIVNDPAGKRKNTQDNTPAVIHTELIPGNTVDVTIAVKGFGSEMKARFAMLNPGDDVVAWVLEQIPLMGAGWCPPGILGIGIGGTAEHAMLLAKKSLLAPVDIQELLARDPQNHIEELRIELYKKVNQLGIGAQGLGGVTTVLDVKINDFPTHAAGLPIALIPNCAATRHIHFSLDGSGLAQLIPPPINNWPDISLTDNTPVKRVNLDQLNQDEIKTWQAGEKILLSGKIVTARDAAHRRIAQLCSKDAPLPISLKNRFIYYVGPVPAIRGEAVGPAGPTTATRMDDYTELMLELGISGMIGKAERGKATIEAIKKHQSVYLIAVGGAAYLVSKAIKSAELLAFADLGMEAIYEFTVEDMPLCVAVDSEGNSIHETGPQYWRDKIATVAASAIPKKT